MSHRALSLRRAQEALERVPWGLGKVVQVRTFTASATSPASRSLHALPSALSRCGSCQVALISQVRR